MESVPVLEPVAIHRFFAGLQDRSPSTRHQAYRTLLTFFRWAVEAGILVDNPLRGFSMRVPKTLPDVPTEEELRAILLACPDTFEGVRNRTMILVLADSGIRAGELCRLLIEDWRPGERGLFIRGGKGGKDRVVFVGPTTTRAIKSYLVVHPLPRPESFLFVNREGGTMKRRYLLQILHRLSKRAGLPKHRYIHPHALRHFAATSWLREGMGLDEVRRLLGHESLNTTLRYSSLVATDLKEAHRKVSAVERLGLR